MVQHNMSVCSGNGVSACYIKTDNVGLFFKAL